MSIETIVDEPLTAVLNDIPKIVACTEVGGFGSLFRLAWLDPLYDVHSGDIFEEHTSRLHNISHEKFDVGEAVLLMHGKHRDSRLYEVKQVEDWPDEISDERQVVTLERFYLLSELGMTKPPEGMTS